MKIAKINILLAIITLLSHFALTAQTFEVRDFGSKDYVIKAINPSEGLTITAKCHTSYY